MGIALFSLGSSFLVISTNAADQMRITRMPFGRTALTLVREDQAQSILCITKKDLLLGKRSADPHCTTRTFNDTETYAESKVKCSSKINISGITIVSTKGITTKFK